MQIDLNNLTEKNIQESTTKQEETIFGVPISEVERQSQAYHIDPPFDQPLNHPSQDPMNAVIEGGKKILNNPKTLKLVRGVYRSDVK